MLLVLIIMWASLLENSLWYRWIMDAYTSCAVCTHLKMEAPRTTLLVFIKIPFGKREHQLHFLCITQWHNNFDVKVIASESSWHTEREWGDDCKGGRDNCIWYCLFHCRQLKGQTNACTLKLKRLHLITGTYLYVIIEECLREMRGRGLYCSS